MTMRINILDNNNCLIGYVQDAKIFNVKGEYLKDAKETATIKEIRDLILNSETAQYSN